MKPNYFLFFVLALFSAHLASAQALLLPSTPVNLYTPGLTLEQIYDSTKAYLDPNDTDEEGPRAKLAEFNQLWSGRVLANDMSASEATNTNMFSQYYGLLTTAATARLTGSTCGTGGYQGAWQVLGPLHASTQTIGKVDALWVDPRATTTIPMHVLAGTIGGLFETKDGGTTWHCLTDNTILTAGMAGISSIAVDPQNYNNIYLGTSSTTQFVEPTVFNTNQYTFFGAGILHSTDGGQTWQQETIPIDPGTGPGNIIANQTERVQRVYISPDHTSLYALANGSIWYRSLTGTAWTELTAHLHSVALNPSSSFYALDDIEFAPTAAHPSQFFVTAGQGNPVYGLYKCLGDDPTSNLQWSRVTSNFSFTGVDPHETSLSGPPTTINESTIYELKCFRYSDDVLYVLGCDLPVSITSGSVYYPLYSDYVYQHEFLFTYTISTQQWTPINTTSVPAGGWSVPGTGLTTYPEFAGAKIQLIVTPGIGNTGGAPNVYIGGNDLNQSYDGGLTFQSIGYYSAGPTHGDIRDIKIFPPNTSYPLNASHNHGKDDILFIATDGGVSEKQYLTSVDVAGSATTVDVSGTGLACGEFWGVATTEAGGLASAGMQHDGYVTYEPMQAQPWANLESADAYRSVFDRSDPKKSFIAGAFSTHYEITPSGGRELGFLNYYSYPNDGSGSVQVLTTDNFGNHHMGVHDLWFYTPKYSTYATASPSSWWQSSTTAYGLTLSSGTLPDIQTIAFSPNYFSTKPVGYIAYKPTSLAGVETQYLFYRGSTTLTSTGFQQIAPPSDASLYPINEIALDPVNTDKVWVAQGSINYDDHAHGRVHYSPNGGGAWYDISNGLPVAMPVSCIVYDEVANTLYCATDVGIYTCNMANFAPGSVDGNGINTSATWTCFSQGISGGPNFPNAMVTHLEINRCQGKLFASTYGRSIWTTDLYPPETLPGVSDVISTNTTWNSDQYIKGCITVNAGKTLTIQNTTVHMPKEGQILVQPGGRLIVNNATITNDCQACMWTGIRALGTQSQPQLATYQAFVTITNSTISNARNAIMLCNDVDNTNDGGLVQATGSTFLNNRRSAEFESYHNYQGNILYPNESYFKNCNFTVDNNYRGDQFSYPFSAMATLWDVEGVNFWSCNFTNSNTNFSDAGFGVGSYNAGYNIGVYCTGPSLISPCTLSPNNTFSGFGIGVNVTGDLSAAFAITVDHASFVSNSVGILDNSVRNVSMTNNNFTVGGGFYVYDVNTPGDFCHQNIGIYCKNATHFKHESNNFIGSTSAANSVYGDWTNFGTVIENSTPSADSIPLDQSFTSLDNQVYKGIFSNLTFACYAVGTNAYSDSYGSYGLSFLCGTYKNNSYDIYVSSMPGIRQIQGGLNYGTNNVFNGTSNPPHIVNNGRAIQYYYTGSNIYPASYNMTYLPATAALDCSATGVPLQAGGLVVKTNINTNLTNYANSVTSLTTDHATLVGLIDGGNTGSLIDAVNAATDGGALNAMLAPVSPYLSQQVLLAASASPFLTHGTYMGLLVSNPESLRDDDFLAALTTSDYNPLTPSDLTLLKTVSVTSITGRSALESTVSNDHTNMSLAANEVLLGMKSPVDSNNATGAVGTDPASIYYGLDNMANYAFVPELTTWLQGINGLWAQYDLLGIYSNLQAGGSKTGADNALSAAASLVSNTSEIQQFDDYATLWSVLSGIRTAGGSVAQLSGTDSTTLAAIANYTTPSPASAMAFSITHQGIVGLGSLTTNLNPLPPIHMPCLFATLGHRALPAQAGTQVNPINSVRSKCQVSEFPNPATDIATFKYELVNTSGAVTLKVSNELGVVVNQQNITNSSGSVTVDLSHYASAMYIFTLTDDKGLIANGKIVKN